MRVWSPNRPNCRPRIQRKEYQTIHLLMYSRMKVTNFIIPYGEQKPKTTRASCPALPPLAAPDRWT
jgi:hypothetical protein